MFRKKYIKYKLKYLDTKNQYGGQICEINNNYDDKMKKFFYAKPEELQQGIDTTKLSDRMKNICEIQPKNKKYETIIKLYDELNVAIIKFIKEFNCTYLDYSKLSSDKDFINHYKIIAEDLKTSYQSNDTDYITKSIQLKKCLSEGSYDPFKYYIDNYLNIIHKCCESLSMFYMIYNDKIKKYEDKDTKRTQQIIECNNLTVRTSFGQYDNKCCDMIKSKSYQSLIRQTQRFNLLLKEIGQYVCDENYRHFLKNEMDYINNISSKIIPK